MQREQRKLEHIELALQLGDGPCSTHLNDLKFIHNCLPELNPADITLSTDILGKQVRFPFFIDAITGSTDAVIEINRKLAQVAARTGIGLAVGSQFGAVRDAQGVASYTVVREENPEGLVLANISALATPAQAQAAVDMLGADALEVHLNVAQEVFMPEGDKNFAGLFVNLCAIRDALSVPVIVKETGCGLAREEYALLAEAGFAYFDCAGVGGTNFPVIEAERAGVKLSEDFANWGMPTCWTLLDALVLPAGSTLLASGGIRTAGDVAKAFALGANAVCITAPVLALVMQSGVEAAVDFIESLAEELRKYLLLLGCSVPQELATVPVVFSGETFTYCQCRGYDVVELCKKRKEIVL